MFLPEPTGENPYESGTPQAPAAKRAAAVAPGSLELESTGASSLEEGSAQPAGLELSEHEASFAWPAGTREVDELGRDLLAVTKGRLEGQQRRHRESQRAKWRRGLRRHFGEGLLIGAVQLGAFSSAVFLPWTWQTLVIALAGSVAMGIASLRSWGTLETAMAMTVTWAALGCWLAEDDMQVIFVGLLATGVIQTSKFVAKGFEDPLR